MRLLDNQNIEVAANVQEHDFSSLQQADELTFVTRQDNFEVQARTMLPNMDSRTRSFEVRLSFAKDRLLPGRQGACNGERKRLTSLRNISYEETRIWGFLSWRRASRAFMP